MNISFKNEDKMGEYSELEEKFINACTGGTVEEVKKYLDEGVNIITHYDCGGYPCNLLVSVYHSNRDVFDLLFEQWIDINHKDPYGDTILMLMCGLRAYNYARDLIKRGANVNTSNDYEFTALYYVACHTCPMFGGSYRECSYEEYVDKCESRYGGYDPSEDIDFFKELVDWGADPYTIIYKNKETSNNQTAIDMIYRREHKQEIEDYINRCKNIKGVISP